MGKARFQGDYKHKGTNEYTHVEVSIVTWVDDGIHFVYSPAIDITGYGNTDEEARESFNTSMSIFIDYTSKKRTLFDELEHLGWMVNRKKKKVTAPDIEEMMNDNETLKEALSHPGAKKSQEQLELQLA